MKFQATALEVKAWSGLKFDVVAEIDDKDDLKDQMKSIFQEAMEDEFERGKEDAEDEMEEKEIDDFWLYEIIAHLESETFDEKDTDELREFCLKFIAENPA